MPQFPFLPHGVDGAARGHFFWVCAVQAGPECLCSPGYLGIPDTAALTPPPTSPSTSVELGKGPGASWNFPATRQASPCPCRSPWRPHPCTAPPSPEPFNRLQRFYFYLQENSIIDHDLYISSQAHVGRARVRKAYACALKAITH